VDVIAPAPVKDISAPTAPRSSPTSRTALALAAFLVVAGLAHFAFPRTYERIVPRFAGDPVFWVRWTGVAELACAALLVNRGTRRVGALLTIAILVAVFPANIKMALDGGIPGKGFPLGSPVVAWLRLPLQVPMIIWAWRASRPS
jgi:uncharacterized membrane protein